jgi:hypothetical protein
MTTKNQILNIKVRMSNINISQDELNKLLSVSDYYVEEERGPLSYHIRDMTEGWESLGSVKEYKSDDGPYIPGTYALVWDNKDEIDNPVLWDSTLLFGETTQAGHKRIYAHTSALKGKTSNMSAKWDKNVVKVNRELGVNLLKNLDKIKIFFRPHKFTDPDWADERVFSGLMEQHAHAMYYAFHDKYTICNSRDIPGTFLIEQSSKKLNELGYIFD